MAAAKTLGELRATRAVEPLIQTLHDANSAVRYECVSALGELRDTRAVGALLLALQDTDKSVRIGAAEALGKLGTQRTLPRKVLADTRMSLQHRWELLETLRRLRFRDKQEGIALHFFLPDIGAFCQQVIQELGRGQEEHGIAREEAVKMLEWLQDQDTLLRAGHSDAATQSQDLLRPALGSGRAMAEELLRSSDTTPEAGGQADGKGD